MTEADARQQQELEEERLLMTLEALDRCWRAGAKREDLLFLSDELGVTWTPREVVVL